MILEVRLKSRLITRKTVGVNEFLQSIKRWVLLYLKHWVYETL